LKQMTKQASLTRVGIFSLWGGVGAFLGSLLGYPIGSSYQKNLIESFIKVGFWDALIAIAIGFAFVLAQNWYLKRALVQTRSLFDVAWRCAIAGLIGGWALVGFRFLFSRYIGNEIAITLAWGLEGAIIAYLIAPVIPNLPRSAALPAGGVAGLLGAIFMFFLGKIGLPSFLSIALGDSLKGIFLGLLLTVTETLIRAAWLEVRYGPQEVRTVTLGADTVSLGSDSSCTVYIHNCAPVALRYRFSEGQIRCEDLATGQTIEVQPGDRRQVGKVEVTVCGMKESDVQAATEATSGAASFSSREPQAMTINQGVTLVRSRTLTLRLSTGKTHFLSPSARLIAQELRGLESTAADGTVAEVNSHPNDPTILGLKNLSAQTWRVITPAGEQVQIDPGRSIKLAVGTKIDFGYVEGEIGE
jgi:hypothetical protein